MRKLFDLLKRLIYFVRTHFVQIILVAAGGFVVLGVGARLLFPEWFIPRYEVEFEGDPSRPRDSATPYTLSETVPADTLGSYLSEEFSLGQQTPGGYTFYDETTQTSITRSSDNSGVQYTDPTAAPSAGVALPSQSTAERAARQFLEELGYPSELRLIEVGFQLTGGNHIEETTQDEATAYQFTFVPELQELAVIGSTGTSPEIEVSVSGNGVFKAFLPPLLFTATQLQAQTVVSVETALNKLALGEFSSAQVTPDTQKTGTFSLENRELVYRLQPETQRISPMYKFIGTYTNSLGKSQDVEVYVNAIE